MIAPRRYDIESTLLNGEVAVLMGGSSAERDVSLNGGMNVHRALQSRIPRARAIDVGDDILDVLLAEKIAHVFLMLHGRGGEDGTIQGALETLGLTYTGASVMASALSMDKLRCKWLWKGLEIATPPWRLLDAGCRYHDLAALLDEQMIVKPSREGSSIGMTRVSCEAELHTAWDLARNYDSDVLVEAWIEGPEYTVAIVGDEVLPPIRLETEHSFYDYEAKYQSSTTRYLCPCGLEQPDELSLKKLAWQAYESVDCSGWGRVDVMSDGPGSFLVLEVNTCPGMTDHSLVPMAAVASGIDFENLVVRIFNDSLAGRNL